MTTVQEKPAIKSWTFVPEQYLLLVVPSMDTLMGIDAAVWDNFMEDLYERLVFEYNDHTIRLQYPYESTEGAKDIVQRMRRTSYHGAKSTAPVEVPSERAMLILKHCAKTWARVKTA